MILYVNGDSHSCGYDAGGIDASYGRHLADKLNATLICDAVGGASNARIIRTTNEYLANNNPDFVIIGWSTWEREEWFYEENYYNVNSAGADVLPIGLVEKYKTWVIEESHNYQNNNNKAHTLIWDFHLSLIERNIPHLFFNCYTHFLSGNNHWGNNYVNPYSKEFTYYFWLQSQRFKPSNPKYFHYGADAHVAWADFLYPHLTKIKIESIMNT